MLGKKSVTAHGLNSTDPETRRI